MACNNGGPTPCIHTSEHTAICPPIDRSGNLAAHGVTAVLIVKDSLIDTDGGQCMHSLSSQHNPGFFANAKGGLLTCIITLLVKHLHKEIVWGSSVESDNILFSLVQHVKFQRKLWLSCAKLRFLGCQLGD